MLKIPTFILGGLLILTGLVGYLFQDPGLSLTITGSLNDNANLKLSDGGQSVPINFQPGKNLSGGEQVFEIIKFSPEDYELDLFGLEPINTKAERQSRKNYVFSKTDTKSKPASYWMATSKGEPLQALLEQNFSANLAEVSESRLRLVYVNDGNEPGPVQLTANKWKGVKGNYKKDTSLAFSKSPTAFIPSLLGLLLIALVVGSEIKPNLRKHLMHAAATIALLSFGYLSFKIFGIVKETFWFRQEANIHISFLKPIVFIFSAGLLFIFLVLCISSFINARKEMAARPKKKEEDREDDGDEEDDFDDEEDDFDDDDDDFDDDDFDDEEDDFGDDDEDEEDDVGKEKKVLKKKKEDKTPIKPLGPAPKKKEGKLPSSKPSGLKLTEKKGPKDKEITKLKTGGKDRGSSGDDDSKPMGKPKDSAVPPDFAKKQDKLGEKKPDDNKPEAKAKLDADKTKSLDKKKNEDPDSSEKKND